ncbi:MAG: hypothetical protein CTY29_08790 [Methylobacter sp.]|nr:MAG: hypothetical protein CTY29_08790 [Methylobacter sp.]
MPEDPKPLHILHVAEILTGGTASYIDELLAYQSRLWGPENITALLPQSRAGFISALPADSLACFDDGCSRIRKILRIRRAFKQLNKQYHFDVVHLHGTFAGLAIRLFFGFSKNRPKLVYCPHGWAFDRNPAALKDELTVLVERLLAHATDRIICVSDHDFTSAMNAGLPRNKLVIIKNAIADKPPSNLRIDWPPGKKRFLFAGRFDRQKGIDLFVKAMQALGDDSFAYAIGDVSIDNLPISEFPDNIKITGWLPRDQVQAYLQSCDVFVMPSRWEGFGLSALEAMRAGKPVIATCTGALPELVVDGVNGILIRPADLPALTHAMHSLLQADLTAMGKASRLRFEHFFSAEALNQAVIMLYRQLLAK